MGISCYSHDSADPLIYNGEIVKAVQKERFSKNKKKVLVSSFNNHLNIDGSTDFLHTRFRGSALYL